MKTRLIAVLALALFLGCGNMERTAPAADSVAAFGRLEQERVDLLAHRSVAVSPSKGIIGEAEVADLPAPTPGVASNMIIRTATALIEVDSLEPAVAAMQQLAARVGGYVGGTGIQTGKNQLRQAFIEVKVPAGRFDEVISGLKPIGKLESVNVAAEDVGEEFVDVTARMDNARRLEQRLIGLLATRTGRLKDVLDVEQSLSRVREEIERYEGRIRYLQAHTAMSTLSVTVHEPLPVVGTAGKSVMGEAFAQAWRNFVALVSLTVQALGVILPLGFLAGIAWFVTRRLRVEKQRTA
jgi:hypothetical protein